MTKNQEINVVTPMDGRDRGIGKDRREGDSCGRGTEDSLVGWGGGYPFLSPSKVMASRIYLN